jgi:hypothetical protein
MSDKANVRVLLGAFGMSQPSSAHTAVFLALAFCAAADGWCIVWCCAGGVRYYGTAVSQADISDARLLLVCCV